jgi:hypothetical protein
LPGGLNLVALAGCNGKGIIYGGKFKRTAKVQKKNKAMRIVVVREKLSKISGSVEK